MPYISEIYTTAPEKGTNATKDKIRLRLYQNGGYTETWKNLQIRYKKIL